MNEGRGSTWSSSGKWRCGPPIDSRAGSSSSSSSFRLPSRTNSEDAAARPAHPADGQYLGQCGETSPYILPDIMFYEQSTSEKGPSKTTQSKHTPETPSTQTPQHTSTQTHTHTQEQKNTHNKHEHRSTLKQAMTQRTINQQTLNSTRQHQKHTHTQPTSPHTTTTHPHSATGPHGNACQQRATRRTPDSRRRNANRGLRNKTAIERRIMTRTDQRRSARRRKEARQERETRGQSRWTAQQKPNRWTTEHG